MQPLFNVLNKIFVHGFYRAHAGMFLFAFLVLFGAVPPNQLLNYHKALMLAFLSSPVLLLVVFGIWLLYAFKTWHYTAAQLTLPHHQFLFYSTGSYTRREQLISWFMIQLNLLLPVILYGFLAAGVGLYYHTWLTALAILLFMLLLSLAGAWFCRRLIGQLSDGNRQSVLLRWSVSVPKPYFSLYIYHIFNSKKLPYTIIKLVSWAVITGVFAMFADVQHDARVAGIAVLCIAVAHVVLIFEARTFEETYLSFARNLPYPRIKLFTGFILVYIVMLLPEIIWLFMRFDALFAVELLILAISIMMLFHSLLYWMGLNMERYITWVLGLFMVIFWVIMFRAIGGITIINTAVAFLLFYYNYYRSFAVTAKQ